jgi:hypothetical protein
MRDPNSRMWLYSRLANRYYGIEVRRYQVQISAKLVILTEVFMGFFSPFR